MTTLEQLAKVAALGVFCDIDGTLSPIAPTPAAARIDPACQAVLADLQPLVPLLAAVSGCAPADAQRLVGLEALIYVGNHGLERWVAGTVTPVPEVLPFVPAVAAVLAELEQHPLPDGVLIENKGVTASVHYRLAADPAAVAAQLQGWLEPLCAAQGLRLLPGRMIIEIRPPLDLHKGTAIRSLIEERALEAAIFLGDDVTDVDGFRMLHTLRAGGLTSLAVGVLSAETPAAVRAHSDVTVAGVEGVADFLRQLVALRKAV